jgi:hypothetical protein
MNQIYEIKRSLLGVLVNVADLAWKEHGVLIGEPLVILTVTNLPFGNISSASIFLKWMQEIKAQGFRDKKAAEGVERLLRLINADAMVRLHARGCRYDEKSI